MFSLVTACMNREQHLKRTLRAWLRLKELEEIVIVDWSNAHPLQSLRALDPRIRIVRVEGEPRWILSYAYNIGISHATRPIILKCDADCMPQPAALACVPGAGHFHAGNWRSGRPLNKACVNGQTIFAKAQFDAVNGYSELIRTYGRDDEDFYDRLIAAGFERREISPRLLEFLDHSEEERTSNQFLSDGAVTVEQRITRGTFYNEMRNYSLAQQMPWSRAQCRATFSTVRQEDRLVVLKRHEGEIEIPGTVAHAAHLFALRCVAAELAGISQAAAAKLDERACLILIGSRTTAAAKPATAIRPPKPSRDVASPQSSTSNVTAAGIAEGAGRHVLLYTDDPGSGGVAQYNHAVLLALARAGYRVSCVQTCSDSPMVSEQRMAGVTHHWIDYHTNRDFMRTLVDGALAERLFAEDRPDLVLFSDCCPFSNLAAREVARMRALPYLSVVGFVAEYLAANFSSHLATLARQQREACEVVAVAGENLALLRDRFGLPAGKGVVIHYGRPARYFQAMDVSVRRRLRAEIGLPADAVVAFTAARLATVKGYDLQLEAIACLDRQSAARSLHFVWAGDGEQGEEIRTALTSLGLRDRVHLLGQRWDVARWLDAADMFVLPSRLEGMPLCIMEAMAKGLPVIATSVSGIPEEMGDTGRLLPDPARSRDRVVMELMHTLAAWSSSPAVRTRVGARARARALQLFREENMIGKTLALIDRHAARPSLAKPGAQHSPLQSSAA